MGSGYEKKYSQEDRISVLERASNKKAKEKETSGTNVPKQGKKLGGNIYAAERRGRKGASHAQREGIRMGDTEEKKRRLKIRAAPRAQESDHRQRSAKGAEKGKKRGEGGTTRRQLGPGGRGGVGRSTP